MPGQKSKVTSLETRKQLLLLESDLNRIQLIESVEEWKDEFHRTKEDLTRFGSIASMAAKAVATVSTARRLFSRPSTNGKASWLSVLLRSVSTGTSLWYLLRSRRDKHDV